MKKSGNISIKAAKQIFGSSKIGSIDIRAAEKKDRMDKTASADIDFNATQFYSPRLTPDTWFLPRSRKMVLKWIKIIVDRDPYLSSILRMHARYPLSGFDIVTNNEKQKELFDAVFHQEDWDIMDTLMETAMSFYRYGEAIGLSDWSEKYGVWTGTTLLDPSIIEVEEIPFTNKVRIYAEIPKKYERLFKSKLPEDKEDREKMPQEIVEMLKQGGKYIELDTTEDGIGKNYDPARCFMITNKTDVGEDGLRGLPPSYSLLKICVYEDFLSKAQFERAKRFAYPIEFWKLGDVSKDIYPTDQDLKNVRELLRGALSAPPFSIIYSPLLSLEVIGASGSLLNITEDLSYVENQKLVGLGTNKNIILGEGSWLGASKTISLQRLIMDYGVDRAMYERKVIKNHYMRALCKRWGYVKRSPITGLITPEIPGVNWHKDLDPQNAEDTKKQYKQDWKDGLISTKTYYTKYPELDPEVERRNLEEEIGTVFDNGVRKLPKVKLPTPPSGAIGDIPEKPEMPQKPENPNKDKDKDKGEEGEERVVKVVEPELQPPPPRPKSKE